MPVNLKLIQAPVTPPKPPKWWLWLLLLLVVLLTGTAWAIFSNQSKAEINSEAFWRTALAIPGLFWLISLVLRIAWFKGLLSTAKGWNKDRQEIISRETQRGQRSLQLFGISLVSALREASDETGEGQWSALKGKVQALKTQASWFDDKGFRHSRLVRVDSEKPEQLLARGLNTLLEELSQVLASVPEDVPLTLLMESNSSLPEAQLQAIWLTCWQRSNIRQHVTTLDDSGLAAVDRWLDQRINDHALLLVVAIQLAPQQPEGTAEAVVGLLMGNGPSARNIDSLASLHRPEQAHGTGVQDLHYALKQSLEWGSMQPADVPSGWLIGVDTAWHEAVASGLKALHSPINIGQDLHDLGSSLGYPGPAAPWLVIACAANECRKGKAQLIVSGDDDDAKSPLWFTLITPHIAS